MELLPTGQIIFKLWLHNIQADEMKADASKQLHLSKLHDAVSHQKYFDSRAGHLWYFFIFSMIKIIFFAFFIKFI